MTLRDYPISISQGILLFVFGNCLNFISYAYASQDFGLRGPSSLSVQDLYIFRSIKRALICVTRFLLVRYRTPDNSNGSKIKDSSSLPSSAQGFPTDMNRLAKLSSEETGVSDAAGSLPLGLGEDSINASSVFAMPMLASRTRGFRPTLFDRPKFIPPRNSGKNYS
ncbi:hypothetical protein ZIOFF_063199 [Zingiber officinale]|uniref:Uncharacterized protein n=1 Tax=Zingiber officinale TaxID=94328 RepID=A0A8J5KFY1_ZINOF|nr:hypothetical protein ZIOFF_063199 [Zingiber officinale]